MKYNSDIILGIVGGLMVGFIMGLVFISRFDQMLASGYRNGYEDQWYEMVSAVGVFLIVGTTLIGIAINAAHKNKLEQDNIAHKNKLEQDSRDRKLMAALPLLQFALREFDQICKTCILGLSNGRNFSLGDPPMLGKDSIECIKTIIENSCPQTQENLAQILRIYNIISSKISGVSSNKIPPISGKKLTTRNAEVIIDLISLRALIRCYFSYGINGATDDFDLNMNYHKNWFFMEIYLFEDDGTGKTTDAQKGDELMDYIKSNGCGYLKKFDTNT